MNFSYIFAGTAGVNPLYIIISGILILAWRVAGWYGLDRWVLPQAGHAMAARDGVPRPRARRHAERPLDEVDRPGGASIAASTSTSSVSVSCRPEAARWRCSPVRRA